MKDKKKEKKKKEDKGDNSRVDWGLYDKRDCFVASVVYGDVNSPEVQVLRNYRDDVLSQNYFGRKFIEFYYGGAGKKVSNLLRDLPSVVSIVRKGLDRLVQKYS